MTAPLPSGAAEPAALEDGSPAEVIHNAIALFGYRCTDDAQLIWLAQARAALSTLRASDAHDAAQRTPLADAIVHLVGCCGSLKGTIEAGLAWRPDLAVRYDEAIERARAALALPTPGADAWRPIATAPKDGTAILIVCSHGQYVARWADEDGDQTDYAWWRVDDNKHGLYPVRGAEPTHWQPLPAAPGAVP